MDVGLLPPPTCDHRRPASPDQLLFLLSFSTSKHRQPPPSSAPPLPRATSGNSSPTSPSSSSSTVRKCQLPSPQPTSSAAQAPPGAPLPLLCVRLLHLFPPELNPGRRRRLSMDAPPSISLPLLCQAAAFHPRQPTFAGLPPNSGALPFVSSFLELVLPLLRAPAAPSLHKAAPISSANTATTTPLLLHGHPLAPELFCCAPRPSHNLLPPPPWQNPPAPPPLPSPDQPTSSLNARSDLHLLIFSTAQPSSVAGACNQAGH